MYLRRIKNKLKSGVNKNYGYYWYKSIRKGNKIIGKFVRKATNEEIKKWLKGKELKA